MATEPSASDDDSTGSDVAFAMMDFSGVNFEESNEGDHDSLAGTIGLDDYDEAAIVFERRCLILDSYDPSSEDEKAVLSARADSSEKAATLVRIKELAQFIANGEYVSALKSNSAHCFLGGVSCDLNSNSVAKLICDRVTSTCTSVASAVEVELLGTAAFNLFLQVNYTGPSLNDRGVNPSMTDSENDPLDGINPHPQFRSILNAEEVSVVEENNDSQVIDTKEKKLEENSRVNDGIGTDIAIETVERRKNVAYHNAVLSELCVDGDWPCQVCQVPYMLLLARSMILPLAHAGRKFWTHSIGIGEDLSIVENLDVVPSAGFAAVAQELQASKLLNGRLVVAHQRLLQGVEPSATLWKELKASYSSCVSAFSNERVTANLEGKALAAKVMLEWGLAQHHFNHERKAKDAFKTAMKFAGLEVKVTGSEGRRTKYQTKATAQYLVKARSSNAIKVTENNQVNKGISNDQAKNQMIQHDEENILLERVKFVDDEENIHYQLSELDLCILLALCLDVKNTNPMDGLTGEQMGGYLERVLHQHDDWMIYATALLERAWLESERNHARERAILQIQALADQHTNRLTMTQSTFKAAVEDSAPPQERLRNLNLIVYPPRWAVLRDLAERYAKIGVVSSAAEIFADLELWDEVIECYQIAGKEDQAEKIVRKRLAEGETPRMWAALGDLTKDPKCFEKSLELSHGRFVSAQVALGVYAFEHGDLDSASENYQKALKIKPLQPAVWFRLGTVSMRLDDWEMALNAFTEVVQQEPDEGDAWANIAAIHMHSKNPAAAYPALVESLKRKRNNWRVWISKLYTCIDLKKFDEATQACQQILDFKLKKNASEAIPHLEEKCVRAIVGGALVNFESATSNKDFVALDSARRTLARVRELLQRLCSVSKEPWVYEVSAFFKDSIGMDDQVLEDLMKEYRALRSIRGWEVDEVQLAKVFSVVSLISEIHKREGNKEDLIKFKLLLNGVVNVIHASHSERKPPEEAKQLEKLRSEIEVLLAAL